MSEKNSQIDFQINLFRFVLNSQVAYELWRIFFLLHDARFKFNSREVEKDALVKIKKFSRTLLNFLPGQKPQCVHSHIIQYKTQKCGRIDGRKFFLS